VADGTPGGSGVGLRAALTQVGASLLALLSTRLELVALELDEERERTAFRLALILVAVLFLAFAVFALSSLVVALFWETHRLTAIVGVALVDLAISLGALWRLRKFQRESPSPFSSTLAELERDRAWVAERFGREP
jgi:uncharacterized membrane protein YqjE